MKCFIVLFLLFAAASLPAQTTTGRIRWKSASNIYYTYTGELKNGKPHGRGFAISEDTGDLWIQVFGEFKDGMIDGRTVIRHSTGRIIVTGWKENKPEGTGVIVTPEKTLEYGDLVNGQMVGKITKIYSDNKISIDNIKDGASNGRVIFINSAGNILSDIVYVGGNANGPGYQYEVENKQMFEGIWENGKWARATTGNYPSFMRSPSFGSSKTDDHIMMYTRLTSDNYMQDTGFLYYTKTNNRQFGYFNRGMLENGVKLIGDNARVIGRFDDEGWQGRCILYEKDKILDFGNYVNGKADGDVIHIMLDPLKIIDGFFSKDIVSGKASILERDGTFTTGNYENGRLNGEALTVKADGSAVRGIYKEGKLEEVKEMNLPSGAKINIHPKDICTAVNFLVKEFENNFKTINSGEEASKDDESFIVRYRDALNASYYFPGATFNRILPDRLGSNDTKQNEFTSGLLVSKDFILVKKQYDNLCRQLMTCPITSLQKAKTMKLVPKLRQQKMEEGRMASLFNVPVYNGKTNTAMVRVMVEKNYDDNYQLTVDIISK